MPTEKSLYVIHNDLRLHLSSQKLNSFWNVWESHINLYNQEESVLCIEVTKIVSFGNFARIASLCVGFHSGTLHG